MENIYFCPDCNSFWSIDSEIPKTNGSCDKCKNRIVYIDYTRSDWDKMPEQQKMETKQRIIDEWSQYSEEERRDIIELKKSTILEQNELDLHEKKIENRWEYENYQNIKTIKNILVFFTVLWGVGMFLALIIVLTQ